MPDDGSDSLWLDISGADGASSSLRVFGGTSLVSSDGVTDWHWTGGNAPMYFSIVDALSPTADEQHVERISTVTTAN